jgi:2'-5' RNA ligase
MQRIFTAIDISEETRRMVSDYIENLRGEFSNIRVGWEREEKLHLTLKFLGDIDEQRLKNLVEAVETTAEQFSKFNLCVAQTGVFPSPRNARILWLGLHDEQQGNLQRLNDILETECERKGFEKEKRNFKPHLTIARLREPAQSKELAGKHLRNDFPSIEFAVSEIVIYESRLQKSGSIYSIVSKYKFKENLNQ